MLGQAMGAVTDATHGMTLSAVSLPYYNLVMPYGVRSSRALPAWSGTWTAQARPSARSRRPAFSP